MLPLPNKIRLDRGQGMTEYLVILALLGITTIGVMTYFGDALKYQYSRAMSSLLGESQSSTMHKPKLSKRAAKRRTLKDFSEAAPQD